MTGPISTKQRIRRIVFFFPFQLVFLHMKQNYLLLMFWLVLFGFAGQWLGTKYGIPYLFLSPEYMGSVGVGSHAILGFALGGFIMAFNIYSYVAHSHKFPFLATLSRPFLKFSINNFIVPAVFVGTYMITAVNFQIEKEFASLVESLLNMAGLLGGILLFIFLSLFYFFRTNKDIFRITGKKREQIKDPKSDKTIPNVLHKRQRWFELHQGRGWVIETYMASPIKIALARDSRHYDDEVLRKVFVQNHINASIFEIVMLVSFIILGSFREIPVFQIPAGASIILLFTMFLMLVSACYSWFKGWTFTILVVALVLLNYGSSKLDMFRLENHAYGLNYNTSKAVYTEDALQALRDQPELHQQDKAHMLEILNRWRAKNVKTDQDAKPKLVIISTSGGGLRSSLWTMRVMQYIDSISGNELLQHTPFITGSSGGMVGAAYMREMYLQQQQGVEGVSIYDAALLDNVSQDVLNPIGVSIATNDLFIRYQSFEYKGQHYTKDRGYAFERKLSQNIDGVLDKALMDYYEPEVNAEIPFMILAPSVVNDGRRLLIAAQPISFLTNNVPNGNVKSEALVEDIEFMRLFEEQGAENLSFMSALRMSATFPYITPTVNMPSEPSIEVMDAGLRDNFGLKTTLQFLYHFREWLSNNTSGVVILQIRDTQKDAQIEGVQSNSLFSKLTSPIGSMYGNFTNVQDYEHDQALQHASEWFSGDIDVVNLCLRHGTEDHISLSWHLTMFEKQTIRNSIYLPDNQAEIRRIIALMKQE